MKVYFVRLKSDKSPIGFFMVTSISDLFYHVDEELDPFACEYCSILETGGMFCFDKPSLCESWDAVMSGIDKKSWKEFTENPYFKNTTERKVL